MNFASLRTTVLYVALALGAADASAQPAPAPGTLRLSVASGAALPLGLAAQRWAALASEGATPPLAVTVHPGATLAGRDAARELRVVAEGGAELAVGSALQWSLQVPALGVFALPWIAPREGDLAAITGHQKLREALAQSLRAFGVELIAIAPLGHREIATAAQPVRSPDDLAGLRIRTEPIPLLHDLLLALGALPRSMSFADAQAAFGNRTLDGQEGRPTSLAAARAGASGLGHLTLWGAVADAMVFIVRKPVWDTLDPAQREALRGAAQQAIEQTGTPAREAAAVEQLARSGVALVRLTPAGHAAFRARAQGVLARWREAIGERIVELAESARPSSRP